MGIRSLFPILLMLSAYIIHGLNFDNSFFPKDAVLGMEKDKKKTSSL